MISVNMNNQLLSDLLNYYNFTEDDYAAFQKLGSINDIPNPFERAASFVNLIDYIKKAIAEKKKFVIYGDYDVDGITSTTIMVKTLKKLGAKVGYFIPSRYKEGYGLNSSRIEEVAKKNYDIIIAVDNGITKVSEVEKAKELGMETIIIDHHEAQSKLPDAKFIFQQFLSNYVDYNISAAFLCMLVSFGLLGYYDEYIVTLAGIAAISDLMPLKNANVALVRMALKNINKYHYKSIMSLVNDKNNVDLHNLSFEIIPILNSAGRIKQGLEVNDAVKLLLTEDDILIKIYSEKFKEYNQERKDLVANGFDLASIDQDKRIIIYQSSLPTGISGLLASRLLSLFDKPVIVYSQDPITKNYTASMRCPKGYNLVTCLENFEDYFVDFGGHSKAAGFTITEKYLDAFLSKIPDVLICSSEEEKAKTIKIDINTFNMEDYNLIESFEPFGVEHDRPLFEITIDKKCLKPSLKNPTHLFYQVNKNLKICFFNGKKEVEGDGDICLLGYFNKNTFFKNSLNIDFMVEEAIK